jgi:hypothetical protein
MLEVTIIVIAALSVVIGLTATAIAITVRAKTIIGVITVILPINTKPAFDLITAAVITVVTSNSVVTETVAITAAITTVITVIVLIILT